MAFESLAAHDFAGAAGAKPFGGSATSFEFGHDFILIARRNLQFYSIQKFPGNPSPVRTAGSKMPVILARAKTMLGKE
jgi:hypothetical protein